jgi:hypothetical protein
MSNRCSYRRKLKIGSSGDGARPGTTPLDQPICVISWPDRSGRGEATLESARTQQSPLLHVGGIDGEMLDIGAAITSWIML